VTDPAPLFVRHARGSVEVEFELVSTHQPGIEVLHFDSLEGKRGANRDLFLRREGVLLEVAILRGEGVRPRFGFGATEGSDSDQEEDGDSRGHRSPRA